MTVHTDLTDELSRPMSQPAPPDDEEPTASAATIGEFAPPPGQPRDWHGRWLSKAGGAGAPAPPPTTGPVPSTSTRSTGADAQKLADDVVHGKPIKVDPADADDVIERFANAPGPVDLTLVSVAGAPNCFSEMRGNGMPRDKMPQIPKDHLEDFATKLQTSGFQISKERADPASLKATQSELDGKKVGGMIGSIHAGKMDLEADRLWVSNDGHVLDGHHRWAATAAISQDCGGCISVPVIRVDAPMSTLLAFAQGYVDQAGIPRAGIGASGGRMEFADAEPLTMATDEADGVDPKDLEGLPHGDGSAFAPQAAATEDRFVQTEPFVQLGPDEVFVPPTIEELQAGTPGTIRNAKTGDERPA